MIRYTTASTDRDLRQILEIQARNMPMAISEEERQREGFVTARHDLDLLRRMNEACPHTIARAGDQVVGYALSMLPAFIALVPNIEHMFSQMADTPYAGVNYLASGQVCIDKPFRRQGVFRGLYAHMKHTFVPPYVCIITEVARSNERSLQAHYAIGFVDFKVYTAGGEHWHLIVWK